MLNRQRREVGIRREVARGSKRLHKPSQDPEVPLGWMKDDSTRLGKPAVDHLEGLPWLQRVCEHLGPGRKPQEREQDRPGKANRLAAGEQSLQPRPNAVMVRGALIQSVEQEVDIEKLQRRLLAKLKLTDDLLVLQRVGQRQGAGQVDPRS